MPVPRLILLAAGLALAAPVLRPMSVIEPTFDELVSEASTIVRATVTSVEPFVALAPNGTRYAKTRVTWKVETVLKGGQESMLQLEFLGGEAGDVHTYVPGMPTFKEGATDYLFIAANRKSLCPLLAGESGRFPVHFDAASGAASVPKAKGKVGRMPKSGTAPSPIDADVPVRDVDFEALVRDRSGTRDP